LLLLTYKLTIILSVGSNIAVVATPFVLVSTGVVLFVSHPICTVLLVNNNVVVPPVVYFETVK
jgi:hypothetical protein